MFSGLLRLPNLFWASGLFCAFSKLLGLFPAFSEPGAFSWPFLVFGIFIFFSVSCRSSSQPFLCLGRLRSFFWTSGPLLGASGFLPAFSGPRACCGLLLSWASSQPFLGLGRFRAFSRLLGTFPIFSGPLLQFT